MRRPRHGRRAAVATQTARRTRFSPLAALAFAAVTGLLSAAALSGPAPESGIDDTVVSPGASAAAQELTAPTGTQLAVIHRDAMNASSLQQALANGGTNYDWAKLVLTFAGLPSTESNITVFTRWMRQENGPQDWWNRNNPLNNGWGSGGNSGLGSYSSLMEAAAYCAQALHSVPGYADIVAGFAASADPNVIERAIWASPWASSHYGNGTHWSHTPVPKVTAPGEAWG